MEGLTFSLCPKCNAIMKTEECLSCGYNVKPTVDTSPKIKPDIETQPAKKEVRSIFEQLVSPDFDLLKNEAEAENLQVKISRKLPVKYIMVGVITVLFILSLAGVLYDLFFKNLNYIKPGEFVQKNSGQSVDEIISAIKNPGAVGIEKTIDLETDLKEGNFEKVNYAMFASSDTNMIIEMFDLSYVLKDILGQKDLYEMLKKDFSFSDDDFEVYFEKSFSIIFPDNNFDKWGLILTSKDEKFVSQRIETYKKFVQEKKVPYLLYQIDTVKKGEDVFVLVSNSKVFLDQMKESAEATLPNLSQDALYVDSTKDLPKLGSIQVYKKPDSKTWEYFTEWSVKEFPDYDGLKDTLMQISAARSVSIYSKDSKTKIISSAE